MSGFDADKIAGEYVARFQALEKSLINKGLDVQTAKELAVEAT